MGSRVNLKSGKRKKLRILEDDAGDTDANIGIAVEDSGDLFDLNIDGFEEGETDGIPEFSGDKPVAIRSGNPAGLWRITHAGSKFYTVSPDNRGERTI
jgi:hypothetical protein